jgi:hypothetical protein
MRLNCVKLLKKNVEKMSIFSLSTMLMKTHKLNLSLHDIIENKGEGSGAATWTSMDATDRPSRADVG